MWRLWAKALGEKSGADDKESDKIAIIRTILFFFIVYGAITNTVIMLGIIRHWNDIPIK